MRQHGSGSTSMSAETFMPAGRGGSLLPSGYLSTAGSQIIDASGSPVRIASVGWDGTLLANGAPDGLNATSLAAAVANMKADGFNTIRLAWNNVMLTTGAKPATGLINYKLNPDLVGLTSMQVLDKVIQAAGAAGMKVILDHHTDEGAIGTVWTNAGHQTNGLWFDSGPGSDGTDGSGNHGTVTAAKFQSDWTTLAGKYAGNSTVIGFDLDNEPGPNGKVNWGQGGPTDVQAMATTVGNAIQKVNPGALIIVEGPMAGGPGPGMPSGGPQGDLSGVATKPVMLGVANKVVYSVHEYPGDITGQVLTTGQYVGQMNAAWGYLVHQNIAPVWIGEMGLSMNGQVDANWASTLLGYMNGEFASVGGPIVSGNQQPVGGDWWRWGNTSGLVDGTVQSDWRTYRPEVQAITDQMTFIAPQAQAGVAAPQPTVPSLAATMQTSIANAIQGAFASNNGSHATVMPASSTSAMAVSASSLSLVIEDSLRSLLTSSHSVRV